MIGFGWQAGNSKRVTNQIFFTDVQDAQGGQAPVQPDVAAAEDNQAHQQVTAEVHHEEVETQGEEELEGAVGGENVEEEDKEDEEEDDVDAVDKLIASGQIKLTASVKRVISVLWQAGSVDLSHQAGNKLNFVICRICQILKIPWLRTGGGKQSRGSCIQKISMRRKREVKQSKRVMLFTFCQCVPSR